MRKTQNTEPESVEGNSTGPTQNNSAAAGKINEIESSENPERMDIDNAEPCREVAEKEVKEVEMEFFEETPNLRELLDNSIYEYNWRFDNLEEAFQNGDEKREESEKKKGILTNKEVYLFWRLEPQFLTFQDEQQDVVIPVVVAVVLPLPPSDKLVIPLVQNELDEIIPMKKMDLVPYISAENRAGLKHLKEDRVNTSTYCLPYFYHPCKEEMNSKETEVLISYADTETLIVCSFDWELDELEELTEMLIEEDKLPSDKEEAFKEFVKEKVREAKKAIQHAKETREKALEEMNEETKTALQNMRFYKFYPVPTADTPDVSTVKSYYINRYYGKAHEIF